MTKLWVFVLSVAWLNNKIRDKVTDFHLDHLDAKHLEADMEDGGLVIREKA